MTGARQIVHVIDDDAGAGDSLVALLRSAGLDARLHTSIGDFLASEPIAGCAVSDLRMPGSGGLELLDELKRRRAPLRVILTTASADVPLAVKAMKLGAFDFIEKPFDDELMISSVRAALAQQCGGEGAAVAREKLESLTAREEDVLNGMLKGKLNRTIAHELGVSVRTVESHRANLMAKTQTKSLPELIRMAMLAEWKGRDA